MRRLNGQMLTVTPFLWIQHPVDEAANFYAGLFDGDERATLELAPDRYAYVHVARGSVTVNGVTLGEGDGVKDLAGAALS